MTHGPMPVYSSMPVDTVGRGLKTLVTKLPVLAILLINRWDFFSAYVHVYIYVDLQYPVLLPYLTPL